MPYVRERLIATGRLKWRFMDFPLQGHANSPPAHLAAGCADEQGRFFEMVDVIFNRQNEWATDSRPDRKMRDYARQVGLDLDRFDTCVETKHAQPLVDADYAEGERLGVNATPTFVVNGRVWPSLLVYDDIKAIVDSLAPVGGAKPRRRRCGGSPDAPPDGDRRAGPAGPARVRLPAAVQAGDRRLADVRRQRRLRARAGQPLRRSSSASRSPRTG